MNKHAISLLGTVLLIGLAVGIGGARQLPKAASLPVEIATLSEATWDQFVPHGKEVDAIYGDVVLRNGYLSAVIAQPLPTRNANMTVREVAGALIDLSIQGDTNDQLAAFYPGKTVFPYRTLSVRDADGQEADAAKTISSRKAIAVRVKAEGTDERPEAVVEYELAPADRFITVLTTFTNRSRESQSVLLEDNFRADGGKEDMVRTPSGSADRFWLEDRYWGQAYGLDAAGYTLQLASGPQTTSIKYESNDGQARIKLEPGQSFVLKRRIYPGSNLPEVHSIARNLSPENSSMTRLMVVNQRGTPISNALLEFKQASVTYGSARVDSSGSLAIVLPGDITGVDVWGYGKKIATGLPIDLSQQMVTLTTEIDPAVITASIVDSSGQPIACKVEFTSMGDAERLNFGPETADFAVHNLVYTADGKFRRTIPAGQYNVTISHGPEYDSVVRQLNLEPGQVVTLDAKLIRSVDTPGWVSTDYHSHSSPSGDNTSSQLGRVLNLVAEQIEFAPCTEHNRISTYQPHIERLGIASVFKSVTGIEMTGSPLPLNHQNAFPMKLVPRTQDGGGPISGPDLETQIERLALHDQRSEKLIQVNHPEIGWMFYDKDGDGKPDHGFERAFPFMDVTEIHPIDDILTRDPLVVHEGKAMPNRIFGWLQLLNQGFRIYGVVNTDAHYNYHGSGWLRNWVQSSTDDPAKIDPMEMVRATEQGRVVVSNGPYLEVTASETGKTDRYVAGQDLKASSGKVSLHVRAQCPNWLEISRLFVLVNGRVHSTHDYSREKNPDLFRGGVVKFEKTLELELKEDAHLIVAVSDPTGKLSSIYGSAMAQTRPTALNNPIFVDVNGDGFQPNKDTLDHPLPTKYVAEKK